MKSTKLSPLFGALAALVASSGLVFAEPQVNQGGSPDGAAPQAPSVAQPEPVAEPDSAPMAPSERAWRDSTGKSDKEKRDRPWRDDWRPAPNELPDRDAMGQPDIDRGARKVTGKDGVKTLSDKDVLRQARRAVADDKALSSAGRKVKMVSNNGTLTLRGSVASDEERNSIVAKAAGIVGADHVVNLLTVKVPKTKP